jgi:putative protease
MLPQPPWKPELLAPAKNLERLRVAIAYGADAIYVGGQQYGLRARADNFTDAELERGVTLAHRHGVKVYVTLNAFLHDVDFEGFVDYCHFLERIGVDAVIVSDLGVIRTLRARSNLEIHLSTQASCLNAYAAQFWKAQGVNRIVVGRELSVQEGGQIQAQADIDVEMFIHGAMCMAYSGHCTISNFTAGRDSNRGGCVQSCRVPYQLHTTEGAPAEVDPLTFMSSKDLWGIDAIQALIEQRICSLKIEGRMKSSFYVAMTCKAYRQLIDRAIANTLTPTALAEITALLQSAPHRDYCSGSLDRAAGPDSVYRSDDTINHGQHEYLGLVLETTPDYLGVRLFEPLQVGDHLEVIPPQGDAIAWDLESLQTVLGEPVERMRQDTVVRIPLSEAPPALQQVTPYTVLCRRSLEAPRPAAMTYAPESITVSHAV